MTAERRGRILQISGAAETLNVKDTKLSTMQGQARHQAEIGGRWKLTCYTQSPLPTLPTCSLKIGQSLEEGWIYCTIQRKQTKTLKNWYLVEEGSQPHKNNFLSCYPPDLCTVKSTGNRTPHISLPMSFLVLRLLLNTSPKSRKFKTLILKTQHMTNVERQYIPVCPGQSCWELFFRHIYW